MMAAGALSQSHGTATNGSMAALASTSQLQISDVREAGWLSYLAYDSEDQHASLYLQGSAWNWVNPAAFGIALSRIDSNGFFSDLSDQALLAYSPATRTIAIAFRGTEFGP